MSGSRKMSPSRRLRFGLEKLSIVFNTSPYISSMLRWVRGRKSPGSTWSAERTVSLWTMIWNCPLYSCTLPRTAMKSLVSKTSATAGTLSHTRASSQPVRSARRRTKNWSPLFFCRISFFWTMNVLSNLSVRLRSFRSAMKSSFFTTPRPRLFLGWHRCRHRSLGCPRHFLAGGSSTERASCSES